MRIKTKLIPHAKERLLERYGLTELPDGKRELIKIISYNRKIYRIGDVYFVWRKSDKRIVTFLTAEQAGEIQ